MKKLLFLLLCSWQTARAITYSAPVLSELSGPALVGQTLVAYHSGALEIENFTWYFGNSTLFPIQVGLAYYTWDVLGGNPLFASLPTPGHGLNPSWTSLLSVAPSGGSLEPYSFIPFARGSLLPIIPEIPVLLEALLPAGILMGQSDGAHEPFIAAGQFNSTAFTATVPDAGDTFGLLFTVCVALLFWRKQ